MNNTTSLSPYRLTWTCFQIGSKCRVPKYATRGTHASVIGNVILTCSSADAARIRNNMKGTKCTEVREFCITDKQFGFIVSVPKIASHAQLELKKKCAIPHLILEGDDCYNLIPVTNKQYTGDAAFGRKYFWH
jgi:hypothetical protein